VHKWVTFLLGWLVGSFFGLTTIMGMLGKRTAPAA
jgi:hypothetical protein